jgi:hypothetical protein
MSVLILIAIYAKQHAIVCMCRLHVLHHRASKLKLICKMYTHDCAVNCTGSLQKPRLSVLNTATCRLGLDLVTALG